MDYRDAKKRLLAAQALLLEPSTSLEKFSSVRVLVKGAHPQLDQFLERADKELATVEKIIGLDSISLTVEHLPENSEEEKKRKKAALLVWKTWNGLKGEVARVQAEMDAANQSSDNIVKSSHWGRIFNFAKGPFGVLTIVAVGLIALSSATSVQITIHNKNCPTMIPSSSSAISLPGISFPKNPIAAGGTGTASIPGIPVTINAATPGTIMVSALTFHLSFNFSGVKSVTLDGKELMGKTTIVNLSEKKSHDLVFSCT